MVRNMMATHMADWSDWGHLGYRVPHVGSGAQLSPRLTHSRPFHQLERVLSSPDIGRELGLNFCTESLFFPPIFVFRIQVPIISSRKLQNPKIFVCL
ncbi:hypothetical protein GDO81_027642 [Engystomops pustulosus]|uniref:Uncharacterized protein n=1 Tax=Engystomops pustulosus TaxID=76066 RepID=A0AAV6Z1J0_ENGPU|nr:hypothetical protein GDO81_027642 [Engystomops pustulosus]